MNTSHKDFLEDIVEAWDSLPRGKHYSPDIVADWLIDKMAPAIAGARVALKDIEK